MLVTADDVTLGKPAPEPFVLAAARLGVDVVDCLVVEDATAGIIAGRAAGASTLALTTTAERIVADLVVPDLSAVRLTAAPGRRAKWEVCPEFTRPRRAGRRSRRHAGSVLAGHTGSVTRRETGDER